MWQEDDYWDNFKGIIWWDTIWWKEIRLKLKITYKNYFLEELIHRCKNVFLEITFSDSMSGASTLDISLIAWASIIQCLIHNWSCMGFDLYCIRCFWLGYYQVSVEFDNQAILCWTSTMDYSYLYRNIYRTKTKLFINVNLILSSVIVSNLLLHLWNFSRFALVKRK